MNLSQTNPTDARFKIATLVDHQREGRFVVAFCPICDHAEEAEDDGGGREQTASESIAKIKVHIRKRHQAAPARVKISVISRPKNQRE
jgi:hypothetical protein